MFVQHPNHWLTHSSLIHDAATVSSAIAQLAEALNTALQTQPAMVICVMRGGLYLTGQLLPALKFPLTLDYLQANRYQGTAGSTLQWRSYPELSLQGQQVIILDDILDEGDTLLAVRAFCLAQGAARVWTCVLADKLHGRPKPLQADFTGLQVPDQYVFGCGMDVYGWWRQLPEIRALHEIKQTPLAD